MEATGGTEREATLVVAADDPPAVAREIAGLAEIAGFRLAPRDPVAIRDVHFDTPHGDLEAGGLALRLRDVGGATLLTLKGAPRTHPDGSVTRTEIEGPWSGDPDDPRAALESLGLVPIQDRETLRTPRDVLATDGAAVAELVVDAVVFHLGGIRVRHYEVEVEARGEGGAEVASAVAAALADRYGVRLRRSVQSKLAVGRALERLQADGALDALLGAGGVLRPAAYERIERVLAT